MKSFDTNSYLKQATQCSKVKHYWRKARLHTPFWRQCQHTHILPNNSKRMIAAHNLNDDFISIYIKCSVAPLIVNAKWMIYTSHPWVEARLSAGRSQWRTENEYIRSKRNVFSYDSKIPFSSHADRYRQQKQRATALKMKDSESISSSRIDTFCRHRQSVARHLILICLSTKTSHHNTFKRVPG